MTLPFPIPVLQTERLILRAPRESDLEAMVAFSASDRTVFLGGPQDRVQTWRGLLANIGHWALRGYGFWSVDTRGGDFVGRVGVICHDGWPEPELAWHLFDGFEGKGYAAEAALAAREHAYGELNMGPLISMIAPANVRSIALAERLGARFERADPGRVKPFHVYRHPKPEAL
ncbi:MAG: GNAT family N-acetyltransferase [Rhodobacteraceae bacterium]|nr:GNAT family N-acetyltransferase [Paracoccaceae bacterium]